MKLELVASNAVVVAHQFNPSIVNQVWLVRNGILGEEEELGSGSVFTEVVVQLKSQDFSLLVTPQQCQFVPTGEAHDSQDLLVSKLGGLVRNLPHTPYSATGINFTWHLTPEESDIPRVTRGLFFMEDRRLYSEFDVDDARFGAYMSKDAMGGRLKLNARPIKVTPEGKEGFETIQFAFNFHHDIESEPNAADHIVNILETWNSSLELSERVVQNVSGAPNERVLD